MSSEVHKYIETAIKKKEVLLNAEVITFPKDQKINNSKNLEKNTHYFWKISDKSNEDQLRAVIGICFMFSTLLILGLYANLL